MSSDKPQSPFAFTPLRSLYRDRDDNDPDRAALTAAEAFSSHKYAGQKVAPARLAVPEDIRRAVTVRLRVKTLLRLRGPILTVSCFRKPKPRGTDVA